MNIKAIIFDWIGTLYGRESGVYSFSERVLKELSEKYQLGLISQARFGVDQRRGEIAKSGLENYFAYIQVTEIKSDETYSEMIKQMQLNANEVAIIDDRVIRGVKIGNQLGCVTYWVEKGEFPHEHPNEETGQPTQRINTVEDLVELL